jgi:uncharacterized protein (TIGR03435 family)
MRYGKRQPISAFAVAIAGGCLLGFSQSRAQAPAERKPLRFEVASVRQSDGKRTGFGLPRPMPGGQRYMAVNSPLMIMFMTAYRITDSQVMGAPDWMFLKPTWDVEAKAERPSTPEQLREMFQNLLADRFNLRFHRETKEMPAYVLSVGKSGSKLKVNDANDLFDEPIKRGERTGVRVGARASMSDLCLNLTFNLNAPVVDKTGLLGFYDFTLDLSSPASSPQAQEPPGPAEPRLEGPERNADLITALREQLGLKLEYRKTPVEVFVIDHVERPSEN